MSAERGPIFGVRADDRALHVDARASSRGTRTRRGHGPQQTAPEPGKRRCMNDQTARDNFIAAWRRGANHYTALAATPTSIPSKLACLVLASYCDRLAAARPHSDWIGPSSEMMEMVLLAEEILGERLYKRIADLTDLSIAALISRALPSS